MAFSVKRKPKPQPAPPTVGVEVVRDARVIEVDRQHGPQKLVIVMPRPFGEAMKLVLLGAVTAAGATYFLLQRRNAASTSGARPADGVPAGGAKNASQSLPQRLSGLASRVKNLAGVLRTVKEVMGDTIGPAVAVAVVEGRKTAREVEAELRRDIDEAEREAAAAEKAARETRDKDKDDKE